MKGRGVVFLKLATEGTEKDLLKFMKEFNVSSPILVDKNRRVAKAHEDFGHHETFLISRKGRTEEKIFGIGIWTSPNMKPLFEHVGAKDN